ncbi:MAG: insulinase family protein [Oscillospiraceae bacterium]|nr:insulinase family protein [Oscillospiraceae bacterium]
MKTIKRKTCASLLLRESYELLELESGLKVVLYQDPTASSATACFAVHYGSTDNRFIPKEGEEPICVPEGIAHYLEHKLFEDENGDAFARFSETGASANAFTSGDKTVFYFTATDRFEENLTILLDFVSTPYFTRETVEKEQGIIAQEIGMYDDNPFWQSYFLLLQSLYHHHSIRIDTAGSVESIRQITPELLHRCYDLFYRPQNMVLTAAGNFNRDRLLELCQTLLPKRPDFEVIRMPEEEPYPVRVKRTEKKMPVSKPLFTLGIKMHPEEDKEKRLKKYVLACVATECLFGESSPFYREMYDAGVINSCFDCSVLEGDGYLAILCDGETEQADLLIDAAKRRIRDFKEKGCDENSFEGIRRTEYGKQIRQFTDMGDLAVQLVDAAFCAYTLFETAEILKEITAEEIQQFVSKELDPENLSIALILPEESGGNQ